MKSVDTKKKEIVVTVSGQDMTFALGDLKLDPSIKPGVSVEVSFEGTTAKAVTIRK